MLRCAALALMVMIAGSLWSQPAIPAATFSGGKPLSQRVVAYQIDARVDAQKKTIDATEILTYHNLTGQPQDTFPFHLYLNAFQPKSTFIREVRRDDPEYEWKEKNFASATVNSVEVGSSNFAHYFVNMYFISPDDGNPDDRTVFEVKVPHPLAPGDSVQFKFSFHDQLGEVLARTGYKRDFIMGGQWFPKIGVWWQGKWNCHQFHSTTEFFADFGTYDVRLTLPQSEVVGASGVEVASVKNSDGTKTVTFHGEDIHDFAWTAEPQYRVVEDSFNGNLGKVKIRMLMQPGHMATAPRYLQVLKGTMERFERWYGPYPYVQITLVDPPHGALSAGGMEYPTLFTADTTWWMPRGLRLPEDVTEHEYGHQYWYGMVATNEFEDAWLDEGINSYSEVKVMSDLYGVDRSIFDFRNLTGGVKGQERWEYSGVADLDPVTRRAYEFLNENSYGGITYGKTATVLVTLEKIIGEDTLQRALHTYFMRYRFTHPTKEDFLKTVEEVSGQNLRWYFDQAVYGTQVFDYEILKADSDRADWYLKEQPDEKAGETLYHSVVGVHRQGDFIFPVEVVVKFNNGEQIREHWDGRDRWVRYSYNRNQSWSQLSWTLTTRRGWTRIFSTTVTPTSPTAVRTRRSRHTG